MAEWEVHPSLHRLRRGDRVVQLEQRVMHVLVCLASHPGELITRETLLERVWPETVVVEKGLTNIISELRHVLEDDPAAPKYIETIRKSGYRMVASVAPIASPAAANGSAGIGEPAESPIPARIGERAVHGAQRSSLRLRAALVVVAALLVPAAILLAARFRSDAPRPESLLLRGTPLTSDPGLEVDPVLSPDGNWVAYAWTGESGAESDIYVKACYGESRLRLTDLPGSERDPAWSPDGSTVAFVHLGAGQGAKASVRTVPAIGGPVRTLVQTGEEILGLSWSPDGKEIAFGGAPAPGRYLEIMLVSVETLETRQVNESSSNYLCAFDPRFSPDGTQIAFTRADVAGLHDLYVVPREGGACRRVTSLCCWMYGLDWTRDGRAIVFSASPRADFGLWRVGVAEGDLSWIPTRSEWVANPQLSRRDGRMVYEDCAYDADIWTMRAPRFSPAATAPAREDPEAGPAEARPLIASTRSDFAGRYSADGRSIVFISKRTGEREIWICDAEGENAQPVTRRGSSQVMEPRWSPDGRQIAFSSIADGWAGIQVLDRQTGAVRPIVTDDCHAFACWWSRDGEWIYFDRQAGNVWELWRLHPDGTGAERISARVHNVVWESGRDGTLFCAVASPAGLHLAAVPPPSAAPFPEATAEPEWVVPRERTERWVAMAPLDDGVYFVEQKAGGRSILGWYDFATLRSDSLAALPPRVVHLNVAPDGSALLFDHASRYTSDLVLAEGIR